MLRAATIYAGATGAAKLRSLANILITAAPALFDDPSARAFMEQAQRLSAAMFRLNRNRSGHRVTDADRELLSERDDALRAALRPLLARLDSDVTVLSEETPE